MWPIAQNCKQSVIHLKLVQDDNLRQSAVLAWTLDVVSFKLKQCDPFNTIMVGFFVPLSVFVITRG